MTALLENVEFWKALSALLWPLLVLIVFFSAKNRIYAFLGRDNLSIKVAGMEISVADATKNLGTSNKSEIKIIMPLFLFTQVIAACKIRASC
jgi:hypothetical protein